MVSLMKTFLATTVLFRREGSSNLLSHIFVALPEKGLKQDLQLNARLSICSCPLLGNKTANYFLISISSDILLESTSVSYSYFVAAAVLLPLPYNAFLWVMIFMLLCYKITCL